MNVPIPVNDGERVAALGEYKILDTEPEQAYNDITLIASQVCGAPMALISLIDTDRQWFKAKVGLDATETPRELAFCAHAIMGKEMFIVDDATRDRRFQEHPAVTNAPHIRFYAGAPLVNPQGHALGTLCVVDHVPRGLSPQQHQALEALGRQVVAQLELRRFNFRVKADLATAAKVQQSLLPSEPPADARAKFSWVYRPCDELGGDILNVFALDEDRIGFYLIDMSGHGVAAALTSVAASRLLAPLPDHTSLVRERLRDKNWRTVTPAQVATQLNRRFTFDLNTAQYLTMLYGVLDCRTGEVRFVCAGHPGPVHAPRQGEPAVIEYPSAPIGMMDAAEFTERTLTLKPGDRLYLHSDGVTEANNDSGEQFGSGRLFDVIRQGKTRSLDASVEAIFSAANAWSGRRLHDDVSILAIEYGR